MAGPLVAAIALFTVVLIAYLSRRQRQMAKPDPNVGAAIVVRQLRAEYETYAPSEPDSGISGLNVS